MMNSCTNEIAQQNKVVELQAEKVKHRDDCVNNESDIVNIYCIYDKVLGQFLAPIYSKIDQDIKRQIKSQVDYSNTILSHFPDNFELYYLGQFDLKNAVFNLNDNKTLVCSLKDLQDDTAKKYYSVLNSINDKFAMFDNAIVEAKELIKELSKREDMINRRTSKLEAIIDSNVDLFPLPLNAESVANSLDTASKRIDSVQAFRDSYRNNLQQDNI